jgi:hypothetical protein
MAVSDRENHWHALHVVHVEDSDVPEFFEGPQIELKTWPQFREGEVPVFHITLGLKNKPDIGRYADVRIDLREKSICRCLCARGHTRQQSYECREQPLISNMFHDSREARSF